MHTLFTQRRILREPTIFLRSNLAARIMISSHTFGLDFSTSMPLSRGNISLHQHTSVCMQNDSHTSVCMQNDRHTRVCMQNDRHRRVCGCIETEVCGCIDTEVCGCINTEVCGWKMRQTHILEEIEKVSGHESHEWYPKIVAKDKVKEEESEWELIGAELEPPQSDTTEGIAARPVIDNGGVECTGHHRSSGRRVKCQRQKVDGQHLEQNEKQVLTGRDGEELVDFQLRAEMDEKVVMHQPCEAEGTREDVVSEQFPDMPFLHHCTPIEHHVVRRHQREGASQREQERHCH